MLIPISSQAEESNHVIIGYNDSIINEIDYFFSTQPTKKNVIWAPKVKGKSKYTFSIPKNAYLISKNHADGSDLFYLSEKTDSGLKFHSNKSKNIDIVISKNNSNLILSQSVLSDMHVGLFLKDKEQISFGVNLNKDVIISNNALGNFGVEQAKDEYTAFYVKFVKLSYNENSEFYGNINHEFKSNYLNIGIGNTWFDIANQFDLTLGIHEQGKKIDSEFYATFGDENFKFEIGFDQIKNNSDMNIFFNLNFENTLNKENFGANIIASSKNNIFGLKKLSLKSFRKKNLDMLWKKYINYN
jgi:hypothetical protein